MLRVEGRGACATARLWGGGSEDNFVKWDPLLLSLGWFWGSNSGHQVCVASALPTEPALEIGSDVSSEYGCLEKHVEGRIPL